MIENEEHLKNQMEEERTKQYKEEHKVILVGAKNGEYKTLDAALDACDEFTSIYLEEGVYTISKPITKPGLIF